LLARGARALAPGHAPGPPPPAGGLGLQRRPVRGSLQGRPDDGQGGGAGPVGVLSRALPQPPGRARLRHGLAPLPRAYAGPGLLGWTLAFPLVKLLLGRDYLGSVPAFRVLALAMAIRLPRIACDGGLTATGHQRAKAVLSLPGLLALVLGSFCFFRLVPGLEPA